LSIRTNALIVTADDYGYSPRYNEGILAAVRAGAVDSVSAMSLRAACDPRPLLEAGVEVGLHLEIDEGSDRRGAAEAVAEQADGFAGLFGRQPSHLDGHHHCHARPEARHAVAGLAERLGVPVRSADPEHRAYLTARDISTPDRVLGRLDSTEPALPPELDGEQLPAGVTEWMVHPGYSDPGSGSRYDEAREEDLRLVLALNARRWWRPARANHARALPRGGGG
jgi:predicted glycoside hydrolase/deacetylase ChbG (UPF0249 family)